MGQPHFLRTHNPPSDAESPCPVGTCIDRRGVLKRFDKIKGNIMTAIQIFENPEFGKVTTAIINGKEHFAATECARALGYVDPYDAIKRHAKGSVKHRVLTTGGTQEVKFISEGDLFRLIVNSQLPSAERFERWVFDEVLPTLRKNGYYISAAERARRDEQIDRLEDELFLLRQQVAGLRNGHGSFSIWDVAQQLRKNHIGNGNGHKLVQMMVDQGLLQKDTSIKKRGLYRPFLKDIRAGYFDHELSNNGQPVPVWKADITITAKGLDWIIQTFLSLQNRKWEQERPIIQHTREVQRRIAGLSPEVGGAILISDECGSRDVWIH